MRPGRRASVPRLHVVTDDEILARPGALRACREILAVGPVALHLRGPATPGGRLHALGRDLLQALLQAPVGEADPAEGALLVVHDRADVALSLALGPASAPGTGHGAASGRGAAGGGSPVGILPGVGLHLPRRGLPLEVVRNRLPGGAKLPLGSSADISDVGLSRSPRPAPPCDWLLVGTLFPSASHPGRPGAGIEALARAVERASAGTAARIAHPPEGRSSTRPAPSVMSGETVRSLPPLVAIGGITEAGVAGVLGTGVHGVAVRSAAWGTPAAPEPHPARAVRRLLQALLPTPLLAFS